MPGPGKPIGTAHPATIGDDQPREGREPLDEPGVLGDEPVPDHVRCLHREVDQVLRTGSDDLVGEREVAVLRVLDARDDGQQLTNELERRPLTRAILRYRAVRARGGAGPATRSAPVRGARARAAPRAPGPPPGSSARPTKYAPRGPMASTTSPPNANDSASAIKIADSLAPITLLRTWSGVRRCRMPCSATPPMPSPVPAPTISPTASGNHGAMPIRPRQSPTRRRPRSGPAPRSAPAGTAGRGRSPARRHRPIRR